METTINEFEDIVRLFKEKTPVETIQKIQKILDYIEAFEEPKKDKLKIIVGTGGTDCLQEMKYTIR